MGYQRVSRSEDVRECYEVIVNTVGDGEKEIYDENFDIAVKFFDTPDVRRIDLNPKRLQRRNGRFQVNLALNDRRKGNGWIVEDDEGNRHLVHSGWFGRLPDAHPNRKQSLQEHQRAFRSFSSDSRWILVGGEEKYLVASIGVDRDAMLKSMSDALGEVVRFKEQVKSGNEPVREEGPGPMATPPENLVLYGPPGTGKTYSTAGEAVRLCGEPVPEYRAALMETYQQLLAAGRIEFVTFHQSISYEDFVEGKQPVTGSDEDDESSTGGFRLETVPGIFRRIAERAGRSKAGDSITVEGRQVFKMSIGNANVPEDAGLFEEAIETGYALLGYGDIDWSDDKYASRDAIVEAWKARGDDHKARSAVQFHHTFRNRVRKGDIVVVSKGNSQFRAIGEFTGCYRFHPRDEGRYAHRRAVHWHWTDRDGVAVREIYRRDFIQKSIYSLDEASLHIPALERYINSERSVVPAEPDPFVLIIDEINRANISKVFGELITLLEPDKRLGQPNALKVRLPYSGDEFGVPSNLHILATMNTADRSIALLDTALRRRFTFREIIPDPSVLEDAKKKCGLDLPRMLDTLNERIEYLYDREHRIGHAYFTGCVKREDVDAVIRDRVIPLLAEYFFEDWGKIAAVLGDAVSHDGPVTGGFLKRSVIEPPPGFADDDDLPRFRWEVRSEDEASTTPA